MTTNTAYADAMAEANTLYADIVDALRAEGIKASVWQTGGMCLAIGINLRDGGEALVGDAVNGPLIWGRGQDGDDGRVKWELGLYMGDDNHTSRCEGYMVDNHGRTDDTDPVQFAQAFAPLLKMLGAAAA